LDQGDAGWWNARPTGTVIGMETITDIPSTKRLERSSSGRVFAGVCAGLGRYFDLSPTFYRLGFVVLTLLGGAGILIYLAAVLVIPQEGKPASLAEEALAQRHEKPWPLIGLGIAGVALAVLLARSALPVAGGGWVVLLVLGLGVLWVSRGNSRGRKLLRAAVATTVTLLALTAAAIAIGVAWFDVSFSDGVGTRIYQPVTASQVRPAYTLGVGDLRLDLSQLGPVTRPTTVHASVGVGRIRVIVPQGMQFAVNAHAKVGELDILSLRQKGSDTTLSTGSGSLLVIDASVGLGRVDVQRAAG
jgi:phage shock protein PspC (stress-responsive transcriptional regulator)